MKVWPRAVAWRVAAALALAVVIIAPSGDGGSFALVGTAFAQSSSGSSVRPPKNAVVRAGSGNRQPWGSTAQFPTNIVKRPSDAGYWRVIREGLRGKVSVPNKEAGVLIQTLNMRRNVASGVFPNRVSDWRYYRNGPLSRIGGWLLLAVIVVLGVFFALRGRIKIEAGFSGRIVERFSSLERFAHWLTAVSFVVLGLTGLNMLYGRYVLRPLIGADAFSAFTAAGKYTHDFLSFAFMAGVVLMVILWVRDNLPDRYDVGWVLKGGGLFSKHSHPPAAKFNTGQKVVFWSVAIGGVVVSYTGLSLMFPQLFTALQSLELIQIVHTAVALVMIAVIIAHIYIGSLGMQGAFDAMGSGYVDENWAREHHSAWVAESKGKPKVEGTAKKGGG